MPPAKKVDLLKSFLTELSETLDLEKTLRKLDMTEREARKVLRSARRELFGCEAETPRPAGKPACFHIHVDGGARGNPGPAGAGAVIKDASGLGIKKLKKYLGVATNNAAEYQALIMGLDEAVKLGAGCVKVFADSELVVKQMKGEYKVKNEGLKPLHKKAHGLAENFEKFAIQHVTRDKNTEADKLANEAIDQKGKKSPQNML